MADTCIYANAGGLLVTSNGSTYSYQLMSAPFHVDPSKYHETSYEYELLQGQM
jgi:hypothetical protein